MPYLPYDVAVSATTQAGEGDLVNRTVLTRQGGTLCVYSSTFAKTDCFVCIVPAPPVIVSSLRTTATIADITWNSQTLDETRGFLLQYLVSHTGGVQIECEGIDHTSDLATS